jgi:recombination protein RecT
MEKLAYLVPRKKKICLDISYRGLIKLGTEVGAIKWAQAEVVFEKDNFQLRGISQEPIHERDPFGDRGKAVGAYCTAKVSDTEYLTTVMSIDEIYAIRNRSEAYKAGKGSPWDTDTGEMIKKTVIRRAYKSWPVTASKSRLEAAVDASSDADQIDFTTVRTVEPASDHSLGQIKELLEKLGRTEKQFVGHLTRVFNRDLKDLSELTDSEINQAVVMLSDMAAKQKAKEVKNENAG